MDSHTMDLFQAIATLRYKIFRLSALVTLGRVFGTCMVNRHIVRDLEEALANADVMKHVSARIQVSEATIQHYHFSNEFPPYFPRQAAFDAKFVYLLKDICIAPESGLMWIPRVAALQQSVGCMPYLYAGKLSEGLRPTKTHRNGGPLVAFANVGYYHALIEELPKVLHALEAFPDAKILVSPARRSFIDGILSLGGISADRMLLADSPLRVSSCVLVPKWVNSGFCPPCEIDILQKAIWPRISTSARADRIYISRSRSVNRPLGREKDLEKELCKLGFDICFFEDMAIADQMAAIHGAKVIVAPHGSGLANLVAARRGTRVIEIISRNWFNTCYAKMAVQLGLDYRYVETMQTGPGQYDISVQAVLSACTGIP